MTTALLLIDIQKDYFPGGRMELEGSIEAAVQAKNVLSLFRERSLPIVHIRHVSARPDATFFVPGTPGIEFHDHVKPLPAETIIEKNYPNSFRETTLLPHLNELGIRRLVIAGMMTHMCVDATTRAAFDFGFACTVVGDACATRSLTHGYTLIPASHVHGAFLVALAVVYAEVTTSDELRANLHRF